MGKGSLWLICSDLLQQEQISKFNKSSIYNLRKELLKEQTRLYVLAWNKRRRLGCVNLASWLPRATGASSRNLSFAFYFMSVCIAVRRVRADVSGARDAREVLLREGALELLLQRRRPRPSHTQPHAGERQRPRPGTDEWMADILHLIVSAYCTLICIIFFNFRLIFMKCPTACVYLMNMIDHLIWRFFALFL